MTIFGGSRGLFKKSGVKVGSGSAFVNIPELTLGDNAFVQSYSSVKAEKTGILQCFNETNHVYAFGHDPDGSSYNVIILAMMNGDCGGNGEVGMKSSGAVREVMDWYSSHRVSKASTPIIDFQADTNKLLKGILTGLTARVEDPELNMVAITLSFKDITGN